MMVEKYIKKFAALFVSAAVAVIISGVLGLSLDSAWLLKLTGYFLALMVAIICLGMAAFAVALWRDKV